MQDVKKSLTTESISVKDQLDPRWCLPWQHNFVLFVTNVGQIKTWRKTHIGSKIHPDNYMFAPVLLVNHEPLWAWWTIFYKRKCKFCLITGSLKEWIVPDVIQLFSTINHKNLPASFKEHLNQHFWQKLLNDQLHKTFSWNYVKYLIYKVKPQNTR